MDCDRITKLLLGIVLFDNSDNRKFCKVLQVSGAYDHEAHKATARTKKRGCKLPSIVHPDWVVNHYLKKITAYVQNNSISSTFTEIFSKSFKLIFGLIFTLFLAFVSCNCWVLHAAMRSTWLPHMQKPMTGRGVCKIPSDTPWFLSGPFSTAINYFN